MSGVTYKGQINAEALARTFLCVQEWLEEQENAQALLPEEEAEVVEIVKQYEGDADVEPFVMVPEPVFVERRRN